MGWAGAAMKGEKTKRSIADTSRIIVRLGNPFTVSFLNDPSQVNLLQVCV
jgi:hypothetical protein